MEFDDVELLEQHWQTDFNLIAEQLTKLFRRHDAHRTACQYLSGLFSPAQRKNSWQLAESMGRSTPYAIQHLLDRCKWNADDLRDYLQNYVSQHLAEHNAIAILDETGFLKKGSHSAGVQRQYSGTAGRIENCQIGVFLAYASSKGHTLIDRALYVPKMWANDSERCLKAKIPQDLSFATKPQLGIQMLKQAFASKLPIAWVTGDCVYGGDFRLRNFLAGCGKSYVLGIQSNHQVYVGLQGVALKNLVSEYDISWHRKSCGNGSKGLRVYDWALMPLQYDSPEGMQHFVLFRRDISKKNEISYYLVLAPVESSLQEIVNVAGSRWAIEESFQIAKGEVGLDEYEVRSWQGWYRHITLAMLAHAFLTVQRAKYLEKKEYKQIDDSLIGSRNQKAYLPVYGTYETTQEMSDIPLVILET